MLIKYDGCGSKKRANDHIEGKKKADYAALPPLTCLVHQIIRKKN